MQHPIRTLFLLGALLLGALTVARPQPLRAAPTDTPTILVDQAQIDAITAHEERVWYWFWDYCPAPRAAGRATFRTTEIARVPAMGGLTRAVYGEDSPIDCSEDTDLGSNVSADDEYIYWMSRYLDGLVRLSVQANVGDTPDVIYGGQTLANSVQAFDDWVYLLHQDYGIIRVLKPANVIVVPTVQTIVSAADIGGNSPQQLWVTGERVLWRNGSTLYQRPLNGGAISTTGGVTAFSGLQCAGGCATDHLYVGKTDDLWHYPEGGAGAIVYSSPVDDAEIVDVKLDADNVYFVERRAVPEGIDLFYDFGLYRLSRSGGAPVLIYSLPHVSEFDYLQFDLTLGGPNDGYLFWHEHGVLKRLPRDAAALPSVDVAITQLEVTQGLQDFGQSVQLIAGKWTAARVHVNADGVDVAGIAAELYRLDAGGNIIGGPLLPDTNYMTVPDIPDRATFEHAFYFRLPQAWVNASSLRLRAVVNPNQIPPEPNFANNSADSGVLELRESPDLPIILLRWEYEVNGTTYAPRQNEEILQTYTWFRRAYPIGSDNLFVSERVIFDDSLGDRVLRVHADCDALLTDEDDDRNFCATLYTNQQAADLRANEGWEADVFIYSMVWDDPGNPDLLFPRGRADGSRISSGPAGPRDYGWDFDGSSADFYMGHEVGHSVTPGHPLGRNAECGHSTQDEDFPRADLSIGTGDLWGFDIGAAGLNPLLVPRVLPNDQWTEVMGYCNNQWLSDYNYENAYDTLSSAARAPQAPVPPVNAGSAFLHLAGSVVQRNDTAIIGVARLYDAAGGVAGGPGDAYELRQRNAANVVVATHTFDGLEAHVHENDNLDSFAVAVPFNPATVKVDIVRRSDSAVLASLALSTNAPVVSNLNAAANGDMLDVSWTGSDLDADALTYDVYVSHSAGSTWTALARNVAANSVAIPLAHVPGGSNGRVRVVANDGLRTGQAIRTNVVIPPQPPRVQIIDPAHNHRVAYGTPISFFGDVFDLQGAVNPASITWRINGVPQPGATGTAFTSGLLPVGTHRVTLRAQNSLGVVGTDTITVIVHDEIGYHAPDLAVGPDQIGWHLPRGATSAPPRTLRVSNVGTGAVDWTLQERADWLSASVNRATGVVTLLADPTQIPPGGEATTVVTIVGDNGETVEIPVSLRRGVAEVWQSGPGLIPTAVALLAQTAGGGSAGLALRAGLALLALAATLRLVRRR